MEIGLFWHKNDSSVGKKPATKVEKLISSIFDQTCETAFNHAKRLDSELYVSSKVKEKL